MLVFGPFNPLTPSMITLDYGEENQIGDKNVYGFYIL